MKVKVGDFTDTDTDSWQKRQVTMIMGEPDWELWMTHVLDICQDCHNN